LKNKANQIRNALDNEQGFYLEIKALRGTKVPTYSWVRFGRSKRLVIRMIQFNDGKVALYTVYPKLKNIFEFNSKDITFTLLKNQKKFWIQTPSKRHTVYFISNYEEKLKDYLHKEGYEILHK
jgi:serine protease inhibitor